MPRVWKIFVVDLDVNAASHKIIEGHRARLYALVEVEKEGDYTVTFLDKTLNMKRSVTVHLRPRFRYVGVDYHPTKVGVHEIEVCIDGSCRKEMIEVVKAPEVPKGLPYHAEVTITIYYDRAVTAGIIDADYDVFAFTKHWSRTFAIRDRYGPKGVVWIELDSDDIRRTYEKNAMPYKSPFEHVRDITLGIDVWAGYQRAHLPIREVVIEVNVDQTPFMVGTRLLRVVLRKPSDEKKITEGSAWLYKVETYEFGVPVDIGNVVENVSIDATIHQGEPCTPAWISVGFTREAVEWLFGPLPIKGTLTANKTSIRPVDEVEFELGIDVLRDIPELLMSSKVVCRAMVYEVETKVTPDGRVITNWKGPYFLSFSSDEKEVGPVRKGSYETSHVVRIEIPRGKVFDPGHPYVTCRGEIILRKPKKKKGEQPTWGAGEESVEESEESVEVINL